MPIYRRLPKRGFNNIFAKDFNEVNAGRIQAAIDAGKLDAKKPVDLAALIAAGVVQAAQGRCSCLWGRRAEGQADLRSACASKSARAIEKAGGKLTVAAIKLLKRLRQLAITSDA
jgi:large subunit ribosomal protein L15